MSEILQTHDMKGNRRMDTQNRNIRSAYWDNIKGLLMLLVVFAHILYQHQDKSEVINGIVDYIYMFHMPAFVFVSGYFGKSERAHSFASIIKLVFLYFIFNSLMGFLYGFGSLIEPVYSYWYLVALIAWRLTAHYIAGFKEINLILFVTALFAGFYPSIDNSFAAARIIGFYPFYMSGYLLSEEKSNALIGKKTASKILTGIGVLTVAGVLAYFSRSFFNYTDQALQMAGYDDPFGAFGRIALYLIAFLMIYALRSLAPNRKIPLLTTLGKNSLWIFILHRPLTLWLSARMEPLSNAPMILLSVLFAIVLCLLLGNDVLAKFANRFLEGGAEIFTARDSTKLTAAKAASLGVALWFIVSVVLSSYKGISFEDLQKLISGETVSTEETDDEEDILFPVMSDETKQRFDNAFHLTFAGDLILLEDQVKRAYSDGSYDFSDMFRYAAPYISSADYAIGVFEGPMAGEAAGYSTSNFDDSKELALNFPDAFAQAVKDAGFDLVTTANNHVLDKGVDGAMRTLDVLDKLGLDHTGSYKSSDAKQKEHIKLVECQGIKMAVLSYTYGSNGASPSALIDGDMSYLTSVIGGTEGEEFEKLKQRVADDFMKAKALSPDLIIVLPHIGTQFSNQPDDEQTVWFEIFKENGADIILCDHSHVVEPACIEDYHGKNVFTAYCPGNFANLYRKNQGDTSMLIDVYIDRETKGVIGGSIVPLYTCAPADGNFRAVPICDLMNDQELRAQLTTDDIDLAENANNIITNVVFGNKIALSSMTERFYFDQNGYLRTKTTGIALSKQMENGTLSSAMQKAERICFIGDSVTEGTKNGGCPWYEPMEALFPDKIFLNYSKGGCTVSYMTQKADEIPSADLYVIALGTNDVRYRNELTCAMTSEAYVEEMNALITKLSESSNAEFVLIAPWYSTDGDTVCSMPYSQKTALNEEYTDALKDYCTAHSYGYINANTYIQKILSVTPDRTYLLDHIHPNATKGVVMYSEAVLSE